MTPAPHHPDEKRSNDARDAAARLEPRSLRTYTPTQAVLARSAGVYHWTPEGRRLYDFTSGVLVANLGHNPEGWMRQFTEYMGWRALAAGKSEPAPAGFYSAVPMTAYHAITGVENEATRRFVSFPREECLDVSRRGRPFDPEPYRRELEALAYQFGRRLGVLITEPYLGGGGSFHPPKEYLQLLQAFCRDNDLILILDEVQSNFGRTGDLFAYETYGLEPDIVGLAKGLSNGVPVA